MASPDLPATPNSSTRTPEEIKTLVKTTYNDPAFAAKYLSWTAPSHRIRIAYLDKLLPHLAAPAPQILELGCGAGVPTTAYLLARLPGAHVTAADISATQLGLAAERLAEHVPHSLALVEADMMALSFRSGSLDAVVAMYSVIHLPRAEQPVLMGRIAEWLKPGGWVCLNLAVGEDGGSENGAWLGDAESGGGAMFWSGWGEEGSIAIVERAGLEVKVREVVADPDGAAFLWILARKAGDDAGG